VSKLINWGHLLATATLSAWGLREFVLAHSEPSSFWYHVTGALLFLVPALGIFLWSRLGYGAAIGVCAFNIAQAFHGPFGPGSAVARVTMGLTLSIVLIWFIHPGVRRQFRVGDAKV
jgi:hypothetical protein